MYLDMHMFLYTFTMCKYMYIIYLPLKTAGVTFWDRINESVRHPVLGRNAHDCGNEITDADWEMKSLIKPSILKYEEHKTLQI